MIVVDTNVISELMRPSPSPVVLSWVRSRDQRDLYTTSVTVAEISYGIERLDVGRRRTDLKSAAEQIFATFGDYVLPFDRAAAMQYAAIVSTREREGSPIDGFDAQIAAICAVRKAKLATRNLEDFRDTGIELTNPWQLN